MQWLNKELNEAQAGSRAHINMPPRVPTFKPTLSPSKASIPPGVTTAPANTTGSSAAMVTPPPARGALIPTAIARAAF